MSIFNEIQRWVIIAACVFTMYNIAVIAGNTTDEVEIISHEVAFYNTPPSQCHITTSNTQKVSH